ncbi:MAG: ABC transporter permease [Anaerohalosphaeraceae bacterium]
MTKTLNKNSPAGIDLKTGPTQNVITVTGRLDAGTVSKLWSKVPSLCSSLTKNPFIIDIQQVTFCDVAGAAFLFELELEARKYTPDIQIVHSNPELQELFERVDKARVKSVLATPTPQTNAITEIGKTVCHLCEDFRDQFMFLGHLLSSFRWTAFHLYRIRWADFFKLIELVGVNALGITVLLGFLFGLIMAFSAAMPLRQFGVEVYVSDLVAIALVRVLGPFITAIIIAGRTGSAFAAELGTMKINNELDALNVMGLEPMRFLVVPRVVSTLLMAPLLVVLTNVAGLIGSGLVIMSLGYGLATYYDHVQYILTMTDVFVGLFKALVFGGLVGGVGCLRGLQTESGAGAVGISTTRAVVSGIVLIVLAEGIFSVLLYILDI